MRKPCQLVTGRPSYVQQAKRKTSHSNVRAVNHVNVYGVFFFTSFRVSDALALFAQRLYTGNILL